jgi:hypothetical protein
MRPKKSDSLPGALEKEHGKFNNKSSSPRNTHGDWALGIDCLSQMESDTNKADCSDLETCPRRNGRKRHKAAQYGREDVCLESDVDDFIVCGTPGMLLF